MEVTNVDSRHLLTQEIGDLRTVVAGLSDVDLTKPTSCTGWRVADVITHLRFGMEGLLQGLVAVTESPVDRDAISYWSDWPPRGLAGFSEVRWLWAQTASYAEAGALKAHFDDVADAAQLAIAHPLHARVSFQSHVMLINDFLSTWVTEFAVHHFDLIFELDDQLPPSGDVVRSLVVTLQTLTGTTNVEGWDQLSFIRKATGREPLSPDDFQRLVVNKDRFPAFG